MQLPKKRGAKSLHGKPAVVNIAMLERKFAADEIVSPKALMQQGLVRNTRNGVKILGDGTLTKKLTIRGCFVSAKAKAQILQAGGKVIGIAHQENVSRET
jgi:large subunit ribosomal protein L15